MLVVATILNHHVVGVLGCAGRCHDLLIIVIVVSFLIIILIALGLPHLTVTLRVH